SATASRRWPSCTAAGHPPPSTSSAPLPRPRTSCGAGRSAPRPATTKSTSSAEYQTSSASTGPRPDAPGSELEDGGDRQADDEEQAGAAGVHEGVRRVPQGPDGPVGRRLGRRRLVEGLPWAAQCGQGA